MSKPGAKIGENPERYSPDIKSPEISLEHWHRYLSVCDLVKDKIVLDIACGEGYGGNLLANYAKKVVAFDGDTSIIKSAQKKYSKGNVTFREGQMQKFPIENNTVDIAVCFEAIEHIAPSDQKLFMNEVGRVLKPDSGILIVSTPNFIEYTKKRNYQNPYHLKEFDKPGLIRFLKKHFKFVKVYSQRIYTASFIWSEEETRKSEFGLSYLTNDYVPQKTINNKKAMMYIAICSQKETNTDITSNCLDVDDTFDLVQREQIDSLKLTILAKDEYVRSLLGELKKYE